MLSVQQIRYFKYYYKKYYNNNFYQNKKNVLDKEKYKYIMTHSYGEFINKYNGFLNRKERKKALLIHLKKIWPKYRYIKN